MKTPVSKAGDGDLYGLTRDDRDVLKQIVEEFRNRRQNTPSRPDTDRSWSEAQDYLAPEVYIVLTASNTDTGTGTGTSAPEDATPEDVDVYKIDTSSASPQTVQAGFTKTVFGTHDVILRDKFGQWIRVNSNPVLSFILRTDLNLGSYAVAERTVYRDSIYDCVGAGTGTGTGTGTGPKQKLLCFVKPVRTFFYVFDRLKEFAGSIDLHCGIAHRLSDTPTRQELCFDPGPPDWWTPPESGEWEWDDRLWEIQRIVCPNFIDCGCQDRENDPCGD